MPLYPGSSGGGGAVTGDATAMDADTARLDVSGGAGSDATLRIANNNGGLDRWLTIDAADAFGHATIDTSQFGTLRLVTNGSPLELVTMPIEFGEVSDPSAPAANKARLYVRDNGSGKTQLVVRFPTGAIQVISTEP